MLELRVLGAGDEALLEAFLSRHRDTSMFLRSNARRAGIVYAGQRWQATYVGGLRGGELFGVAAHAWSGGVLLQAPEQTGAIARACVDASGRAVSALLGPLAQVRAAEAALGLAAAPAALREDEILYTLDLAELVVPAPLLDGRVSARPPLDSERALLRAWRVAYDIESLGARDGEELRESAAACIDAQIDDGVAWVAVVGAAPVSYSAFNASLPDVVQLGGIYTPPELRARGYARAAVAHSLRIARERGAQRAVLFTKNPSAARAYEAVGFRPAGDYSLVRLA